MKVCLLGLVSLYAVYLVIVQYWQNQLVLFARYRRNAHNVGPGGRAEVLVDRRFFSETLSMTGDYDPFTAQEPLKTGDAGHVHPLIHKIFIRHS